MDRKLTIRVEKTIKPFSSKLPQLIPSDTKGLLLVKPAMHIQTSLATTIDVQMQ